MHLCFSQKAATMLEEVEQSPPSSTIFAMKACSDALVDPALLRHKDKDVGLLVALCISEIMRIVAPDAPYSDDCLKVCLCFVMFVSSVHKLQQTTLSTFPYACMVSDFFIRFQLCGTTFLQSVCSLSDGKIFSTGNFPVDCGHLPRAG
jgi:sister-chromatid-cohesion protein PDS5